MSKKKPLSKIATGSSMSRADYDMTRMRYTDLKRACIARGMSFEDASNGSIPKLHSWFSQHYEDGQNLLLLEEYDSWFEALMIEKGYKKDDAILHNSLKMGFIANSENGNTKKPRLGNNGLAKKEKPKRERIEGTKVFKGTKKALTYQSQKEGVSIANTVAMVLEKFPDANEKSVRIWYKRSSNEGKKK